MKTDWDWNDWRLQFRNRIQKIEELKQYINVTPEEEQAIKRCEGIYRWAVTPYYASLMDKDDPSCPIRKQAIPSSGEFMINEYSDVDPVGDTKYRVTNRIVHKYPDRIIMLITDQCPVYCRHCTRKYHTTDLDGTYFERSEAEGYEIDFEYIENHPEIRDVLLTGGDPLTYSDRRLESILKRLRSIPHVEIIRFGSRYPVLLPQRITKEFCEMLEKYHPIWLNTHFNHPKEVTKESAHAVNLLLKHGVPVQNQSVLLKGINDDLDTMKQLVQALLKIRVRPYYLYHCDNVTGVSHFMTSLEKGVEIMRGLVGHTTGFATPNYIITTINGKIPIPLETVLEHSDEGLILKSYEDKETVIPYLKAETKKV
ncbi:MULTISPECIES: arginine 2,3-aminomutase [Bacillus]|uniref:arginine 2,3-aminomutase n=1 Tax=Bacillus TaxID=1386 RepID=UPI0001A18D89|nr:arginine 2,3-aminomutase [Bacillus pseudomycoides]EEM14117.1 Arginine aminomutase [Bacillus pseudomycoides DSM 12442]MED1599339.1 arginine 2,3-aminomutase [Bacillus pseudomycoides]MED4711298.1 arginine 2,3-aminomutase [Bacillus pseudomycoides]OOR49878.1 arginine 2,3-aminomutase [Bacillus pseudomycoides]PDY10553.1 arginine 2,3-aminomutase [Bacillus pseudomycoides]